MNLNMQSLHQHSRLKSNLVTLSCMLSIQCLEKVFRNQRIDGYIEISFKYPCKNHSREIWQFYGPNFIVVLCKVSLEIPSTSTQTSLEISFMGSLEDSIFSSIAWFFYQKAILCCRQNAVSNTLQGSKQVANNLDLYRSTCNIAVDPHMMLIVSTVEPLCMEQTWPL